MKKLICIITLLIISLLSLFCFSACGENEVSLVSVKLDSNNKSEIIVGGFNYSEYNLILQYSDGTSQTIPFDESMVDSKQLLLLYKTGEYSLDINYQGYKLVQNIIVKINTFSDEIKLVNKVVTYDGNKYGLEIAGPLPEGTSITYPRGNSFINANTYTITAVLASDLYVSKTIEGELTIEQADYDMSGISFNDSGLLIYDGKPKSISVTGTIPTDLTLSYYIGDESTNERTNAGTYEVEARFNAGPNYKKIPSKKATLTIEKGNYDMSNYKLSNKIVTYNGKEHSIILTNGDNLPNGVTVDYENNNKIKAGQYIVKAKFYGDVNNYNEIADKEAVLTISKANINLTGVHLDANKFTYDGSRHYIYYTGKLPDGVSFVDYTNNGQIDAGDYIVSANFAYYDTENFNPIEPLTCHLVIEKTTYTGIVFNDVSYTYDGFGHSIAVENIPSGVTVDYQNNGQKEPGTYLVTAKFNCGDDFLKNYQSLSELSANLTINKKTIGTTFNDITVDFDGNSHTFDALSGSTEKEWMTVSYYTLGINKAEIDFNGATEPGSYLVFARFGVKNGYLSLYENYYEELDTQSAILTINKIQYVPKFVGQMTEYTGSSQSVLVDMDDASNYPGLTFDVVYDNNTQTDPGVYTGSAHFTLTGNSTKYYNNIEDTTFKYCIKKGEIVYSPILLGSSVVYNEKPHSLTLKNKIEGIDVEMLNNVGTVPGIYIVTVIVNITDPILNYYYSLPSEYEEYISGGKYTQVNLKIEKKEVDLTYDVGPFEYTGENISSKCVNNPSWISVSYSYEQEDRKVPGKYTVTATPKIINSEQAKLYKVTPKTYTFTIEKAYATYSFSNLNIKYDGLLHEVKVLNLPKDISYYTSGDKKKDVGVYSVQIFFINNNPCYYDIPKQNVTLKIEYTTVDISDFVLYQNSIGRKYVSQYSKVSNLLFNYLDSYSLNVSWQAHYFQDAVNMYPNEDTTRHGNSDNGNFTLSHSTTGDEYVFLMYSISPKEGFVFSNQSYGNTFTGSMQLTVGEVEKLNIDNIVSLDNTVINIDQDTLFSDFIKQYVVIDNIDYSANVYYYIGTKKYPSTYNNSSFVKNFEENKDFSFVRPTWDNTSVRIYISLKAKSGYCLYYQNIGCITKDISINAHVLPKDVVDCEFITSINDTIEFNQFDNIIDVLSKKVDTSIVDYTWELYQKGNNTLLVSSQDDLINLEDFGIVDNVFTKADINNLVIKFNIQIKDVWMCNKCNTLISSTTEPTSCTNNLCTGETSFEHKDYYLYGSKLKTYSNTVDVVVNSKKVINLNEIIELFDYIHNKQAAYQDKDIKYVDVDQYSYYFVDYFTYPIETEGLVFEWVYFDVDGSSLISTSSKDIQFTKVSNDIYSYIYLVFQVNDGYIISYDNKYYNVFETSYYFNVLPAEIIDIVEFVSYCDDFGYKTMKQYNSLDSEISLILDNISAQCVDVKIDLIIMLFDASENMLEMNTIPYTDNYIFTKYTEKDCYYKIIYMLNIDVNSGFVFNGNNSYFVNGIKNYVIERRERFIDPEILYLQNSDQIIYQNESIHSFLSTSKISNKFDINSWKVDYYTQDDNEYQSGNEEYHSTGNGLIDFVFKYATNDNNYVSLKLFLTSKDGYVYVDDEGVYYDIVLLSINIDIKPRYTVQIQNITNYTNNGAYVEQFSHLSDCIKTLFVNDEYYDDIKIDWKLTHSLNYTPFTHTYTPDYKDVYFYKPISDGCYFTLTITLNGSSNYTLVDEAHVAVDQITAQFNIYENNWTKINMTEYNDFWFGKNQASIIGTNTHSYGSLYDYINLDNMLNYADFSDLLLRDNDMDYTFSNLDQIKSFYITHYAYIVKYQLNSKYGNYFGIDESNNPITKLDINKVVKGVNVVNFEINNIFTLMNQINYVTVNELLPIYAQGGLYVNYYIRESDGIRGVSSQQALYFSSKTPDTFRYYYVDIIYDVPSDKTSQYVSLNSDDIVARKSVNVRIKYIVT